MLWVNFCTTLGTRLTLTRAAFAADCNFFNQKFAHLCACLRETSVCLSGFVHVKSKWNVTPAVDSDSLHLAAAAAELLILRLNLTIPM